MSVVVAITDGIDVVIASDGRSCSTGVAILSESTPKLKPMPEWGSIFGCVGTGLTSKKLDLFLADPQATPDRLYGEFVPDESALLWVANTEAGPRILSSDSVGSWVVMDEFAAIGAGDAYAIGALEALRRQPDYSLQEKARVAVKTAIKHCAACGGKVYIKTLRGKRGGKHGNQKV